MNLANEGLEARKKDEEVAQRKRKAEEDKTWEGTLLLFLFFVFPLIPPSIFTETREQRVDSWRSFSNTSKKKKKTKTAFLG